MGVSSRRGPPDDPGPLRITARSGAVPVAIPVLLDRDLAVERVASRLGHLPRGQGGRDPHPAVAGLPAIPRCAVSHWVASRRGSVYYRIGCSGANQLVVRNRVYFKSEADAKAAGYSPSRTRGC